MRLRFVIRLVLLAIGFALTTAGLLAWQEAQFSLENIWPFENGLRAHPLHILILGLALIPPTLWEIFVLESRRRRDR